MTNERRKQIRRRRKRKNKNKNRFVIWFKQLSKGKKAALIAGAVVLVLLLGIVGYVSWMFSKLNTEKIAEEDIVINDFADETVGEGYTNFVLFGGDSRSNDVKSSLNTDVNIIVSLNNETKEVKMVSVYRDTLLDVGGGSIRKCNSAYSRGGATQAVNMLNRNLDLNIQKYVTVNWKAVTDVVDMLGGVEVDVSEREYKEVNRYIGETGMVAGKKVKFLTRAGVQTLDGVQATTYARIRKNVGDDYARTERQRLIIQKVAEKAMKSDIGTLTKIINTVFPQIYTNLSMTEILGYAKDFTKYKIGETSGFPMEKGSSKIPGLGSSVYPITLKKNVSLLHEFLYGTEGYEPSSTVVKISGEIAYVVGNREVEPNSTWTDPGTTDDTNSDGDKTETTNPDAGDGSDQDGSGSDTDDGSDQGGSDQGGSGSDQGGSDQGGSGSDQGGSDQGGSDQGGSDQGGSDQGGSDQGGSDQGGSDQGGSDQGGSDQGGSDTGDPS